MPIYIDVQPRLDDRAAAKAADQAKKHFSDASKSIGQDFSKALSSGLSSSDAAVRKSAENAEKAFKRAADAAGQTRVEEAKLEDLRTKGTGGTALLAQSERRDKALRAEVATTRTAVTSLRDLDTAQLTAVRSGSALSNLLSGIASGASGTRLGGMASQAESLSTKLGGISPVAVGATAGIAALAVGAGVAVKSLYDLGAQWDNISDSITIRTGKLGADLKALKDVVGEIGSTTAAPLGSISEIVGQLSQSNPDLTANSAALHEMGSNLAYLAANGQAVDVRALSEAFNVFGVKATDQVSALDALAGTSRATGIPLNQLIQTVQSGAPQFKQFGLNMAESTGLLASFEHAGLDAGTAVTGLKIALKNIGGDDADKKLTEIITQIKALHDANNEPGARDLAKDFFGAKNFGPFLDAIESGKVSVAGLKKLIDDLGPSLQQMQNETDDGAQGWEKLTNTLKSKLGPAADFVFGAINTSVQVATGNTNDLLSATDKLGEHLAGLNDVKIAPDSALGRILVPGVLQPGPAAATPAGPPLPFVGPNQPGGGTTPGPQTNTFYSDWYPATKPDAKKTGLPTAPAVAYDTSLPQGFAGVPQTAEIVGAENSWMDARQTLAEARARVDQLEKDNNATADDITKAKNAVINAQQGQNQAELRLYDARQTLYDKNTKQIKGYADQMGEIGAKLDQDLGISKGLPGIADNLVRFIASLAAAPLLGPLNAISQAQGGIDKTGSGLMGILAGQGAFGPQYTPTGMAAAEAARSGGSSGSSASLPSATLPTISSAADVAAGGSRVQALYALASSLEGTPYSTQLRNDCSGMMNQLVNAALGLPQPGPGERFSTPTEGAFLQAHGFQQLPQGGVAPPGSFQIGVDPDPGMAGHTAGTLPNGQNVEQGGSTNSFTVGPGAAGANSPQFSQRYYLPMMAPGMASGGGIPIIAHPGEHMLNADDVKAMGGQTSVYNFRSALHMSGGGSIPLQPPPPPPPPPPAVQVQHMPTSSGQGGGSVPGPQPMAGNALAGTTLGQPGPPVSSGQGGGPAPGPSPIGGAEKPTPPGGGVSGGGLVGAATGAAAMAADMFAPGSGAAVQIASQEIQRAIKFGAQATGIIAGGLLDTFLPTGGSDLANNNWITRIGGAFAGVQPQIPNIAGKSASVDAMQKQQTPQMALPPPISGSAAPPGGPQVVNNIQYHNNGVANDPNVGTLGDHLVQQYQNMPGQR